MILELMPYRACYPIFKLVYSATANASSNMGLNKALPAPIPKIPILKMSKGGYRFRYRKNWVFSGSGSGRYWDGIRI
ncbi:putative ribosomal protein L22/L17 superfamily [Helianthus anomalus]